MLRTTALRNWTPLAHYKTLTLKLLFYYSFGSCSAAVGMTGNGKQGVSLGTGCEFKGLAMHELMHAIGFWHEMNRYDRDDYININFTNITPGECPLHDADCFD